MVRSITTNLCEGLKVLTPHTQPQHRFLQVKNERLKVVHDPRQASSLETITQLVIRQIGTLPQKDATLLLKQLEKTETLFMDASKQLSGWQQVLNKIVGVWNLFASHKITTLSTQRAELQAMISAAKARAIDPTTDRTSRKKDKRSSKTDRSHSKSHSRHSEKSSVKPRPLAHASKKPKKGSLSASAATSPKGDSYTNRDLVGIWGQTEKMINARSYPYHGKTVTIRNAGKTTRWDTPKRLQPSSKINQYRTSFQVVNQDIVDCGIELNRDYPGKTVIINPANDVDRGGGYARGAKALEEDLCRRSNLLPQLQTQHYPLDKATVLHTRNVSFFRQGAQKRYACMKKPERLSVITSAALDLNPNHATIPYYGDKTAILQDTERRIYNQLLVAEQEGHQAVVLTAFGCGAFSNSPDDVAGLYYKVIHKYFPGVFAKISFAIINDRNTGKAHNRRGNFAPFHERFMQGRRVVVSDEEY